jgi:hypothetical protein
MTSSQAEALYKGAKILAGAIVVLAIATFVYNAARGEPIFPIAPLLLAGAIWLIGRLCRSVVPDR